MRECTLLAAAVFAVLPLVCTSVLALMNAHVNNNSRYFSNSSSSANQYDSDAAEIEAAKERKDMLLL